MFHLLKTRLKAKVPEMAAEQTGHQGIPMDHRPALHQTEVYLNVSSGKVSFNVTNENAFRQIPVS